MTRLRAMLGAIAAVSVMMTAASAGAQEVKHYRFAYDQPKTTGYGIVGDIFSDRLKALSKGTMLIDSIPARNSGRNRRCCSS
jgi:TRAP-type transport system periplasmic protein